MQSSSGRSGIGVVSALLDYGLVFDLPAIVFVVLKLRNVVRWSWWWVLSPLWIWAAIVLLVMAAVFVGLVINKCRRGRGR